MKKFIIAGLLFYASCNASPEMETIKKEKVGEIHKIMQRAEKKWPGNYRMQCYEITEQTEAFIELEKMKNLINQNISLGKNSKSVEKKGLPAKSTQEARDFYAALEKIDKDRYK